MKYSDSKNIVSSERLQRYLDACDGDQEKTLDLYRANVRVSLEMFAIVGAFEIALRNAIDKVMTSNYGADWLRDAVLPGGFFDIPQCRDHAQIIPSPQYRASGRILLRIFPNKPTSTRQIQYNNTTIFNELDHVNSLRNRIAHHEPICFPTGKSEITTDYGQIFYN